MEGKVEWAAFGVSVIGCVCSVLTRLLPMWTVRGSFDNTTGLLPVYWDGVWMDWEHHSVGMLHCTFYQTLLSLTGNFGFWKGLILASIGVGLLSIIVYLVGQLMFPKIRKVRLVSGLLFMLSGVPLLVAVSWTAHDTTQELESFVNMRRDLGSAMYAGWTGIILLVVGGGLLCVCNAHNGQRMPANTTQEEPFLSTPMAIYRHNSPPYPVGTI